MPADGQSRTTKPDITPIEKALLGVPLRAMHRILPGTIAVVVIGLLSSGLSRFIGETILGFETSPISVVMTALIIGLILGNTIALPSFFAPGINFAMKKLLRLGIIFLGIRLSIGEVLRLGVIGLPIVAGCILGALVITTLINRTMHLPSKLGALIAVGTSICGVSAIVATGPAIKANDEEITYAVSVITVFGIFATLVYPPLSKLIFSGDHVRAGLFLGTAIHDTSQVTGAGLAYSQMFGVSDTLNVATVTKLVRNIFMGLLIPIFGVVYGRDSGGADPRSIHSTKKSIFSVIPLFILGFILFAFVRTAGDMTVASSGRAFGIFEETDWSGLHGGIKQAAVYLLVFALAGVGLRTRFRNFKALGFKPFIVGLVAAVAVGVISFGMISILGALVTIQM